MKEIGRRLESLYPKTNQSTRAQLGTCTRQKCLQLDIPETLVQNALHRLVRIAAINLR